MYLKNDPFGAAVADYYKTREKEVINVFSDIAEPDVIPVEYLFRDFYEMPVIEKEALREAKGKVLDVGAGAGSHSLWLQEKGMDVTALEISEKATEIMRKRGVEKVINDDFFSFFSAQKYDTLLFLMNGAGIAGTLENLQKFLERCKTLLNPGGKVLIDSSDISYMFDDGDEIPEHYYGEVNYIMEYKGIKSEPFSWLFVDFYTLTKFVEKTGGSCKKIVDGEHFDYLAEIKWY